MNIEQERADFEAWYRQKYDSTLYCESRWEVWQARAALQGSLDKSQDRADAVERLIEAVRNYMSFGCPVCSGDCFSANPPVSACPVREAQEAIDHARRIEGQA